jgi:electron transport complex protein RnfB
MDSDVPRTISRRKILFTAAKALGPVLLGGSSLVSLLHCAARGHAWRIDPSQCIACGKCGTTCVLGTSAVRCVPVSVSNPQDTNCGACYQPRARQRSDDAENRICPTNALRRIELGSGGCAYSVDRKLCNGCGACVRQDRKSGDGSLVLEVQQDLCMHCNECAIARQCPKNAWIRMPASIENQAALGVDNAEDNDRSTGGEEE